MTKRIVLGVGGGIAAYKVADALRKLVEAGYDVVVVPTESALRFVGEPTWSALSHNKVAADVWSEADKVPHVHLGRQADLVVIAPATADLIAKAAGGLADDLLTNTLLTAQCPVLFVPAMHTEMWEHAATVENVATLRARGVVVLEPATGRLTGADTGKGRLPEPIEITRAAQLLLMRADALPFDLAGRRVLISAGGTREAVDPVRYLGNASSGKQGYALAAVAAARGAKVTVVSANVELPVPAGVEVCHVVSAAQLREAVLERASSTDAVVMAAAVADFRPINPGAFKIKKSGAPPAAIELDENADVLSELVATRRPGQVIVGFAAETGDEHGDVHFHGRVKLERKKCDIMVVNSVSEGRVFGGDDNAGLILGLDGSEQFIPKGPKAFLAAAVWDAVSARL